MGTEYFKRQVKNKFNDRKFLYTKYTTNWFKRAKKDEKSNH